eukprot:3410582-Prorocentrum_lima.AAC.1
MSLTPCKRGPLPSKPWSTMRCSEYKCTKTWNWHQGAAAPRSTPVRRHRPRVRPRGAPGSSRGTTSRP